MSFTVCFTLPVEDLNGNNVCIFCEEYENCLNFWRICYSPSQNLSGANPDDGLVNRL